MPVKRRLTKYTERQLEEDQGSSTLLDVYQNFTFGIYRMLRIKPEWIEGLDEVTSLFSIIGSIAFFLIGLEYTKVERGGYVSTLFNGSNFDSYGCKHVVMNDTHFYGDGAPQFAIELNHHEFSMSTLLSAAGRLQCEKNIPFVVAEESVLRETYPELKKMIPQEGSNMLINEFPLNPNELSYYTFSLKQSDLWLYDYEGKEELLDTLDIVSEEVYVELQEIVQSKVSHFFINTLFRTISVNYAVYCVLLPITGIVIAMNLNILHKYLRKIIIKNTLKFAAFRALIGIVIYGLLMGITKLGTLVGHSIDSTVLLSDAFLKMIVCLSLLFSGLFGKVFKQCNDTYAHEETLISFMGLLITVIAKNNLCSFFLYITVYSIAGMYFQDYMIRKNIVRRPWTRNASFIVFQLVIPYAYLYKVVMLLEQEETIPFYTKVAYIVTLVQVLFGYMISIYQLTSGPLVLYSVTALAVYMFLQEAIVNLPERSLLDNLSGKPKLSSLPLLNQEYYLQLFCHEDECDYQIGNVEGKIKLAEKDEKKYLSLFNEKVAFELKEPTGEKIERSNLLCQQIRLEEVTKLLFRGIVDLWMCQ